jgi:hypothetical protein
MTVAATVMTVPVTQLPPWDWPVETHQYERRVELADAERDAITGLGWQLRRRRGYDHTAMAWQRIGWLLVLQPWVGILSGVVRGRGTATG